ncbi:hypothetical protein BWI92_13085 [Flectobacillus sp. BAB-3569]|nr:hypothetical protein BWI92_13085 [Flectobacillus sp. BAB-3569]
MPNLLSGIKNGLFWHTDRLSAKLTEFSVGIKIVKYFTSSDEKKMRKAQSERWNKPILTFDLKRKQDI